MIFVPFVRMIGLLLPDGLCWREFAASSSQEEVDDPDSSSVDRVGGWSPTWLDWKEREREKMR